MKKKVSLVALFLAILGLGLPPAWASNTKDKEIYTSRIEEAVSGAGVMIDKLLTVKDGTLIFEGATQNAYETTFQVTDPTADRTVTVPDATGTVAMTTGTGSYRSFTILTDNAVLTTADCGKVYGIGTDAKTITLPATAAGCWLQFVNTGAAGNNILELVPNAADQVFGTVTLAASVVVIAGAAGEHVLNTKASAKRGDSMTLIGDGVDGWYITASTGIWAEATP